MSVVIEIKQATQKAIQSLYNIVIEEDKILVNETNEGFEGDYTVVLFAFVKQLKKAPDALGNEIGEVLIKENPYLFTSYNLVKGFLNLVISDDYWISFLAKQKNNNSFGIGANKQQKVMIEYSSPNTNKPLHLGHLRNNFLGKSVALILQAAGYDIVKTCVVNDRGIHICKSMLAWQMFGNGATPESTGIKGDHLVGDYYVKFNDEYKKEIEALLHTGITKEEAEKEAPVMKAAQQMLIDWEKGDADVLGLWTMMNTWVYKGFDETYKKIGTDFDKVYFESNTYLLGKDLVQQGLEKTVFYTKDDSSVWIDLTGDGLDEKIVQRRDGTSVYITQDIGLAEQKQKEFGIDKSIYVVGDEQNYHFKVLKLICQKLGLPSADGIYHLSYGMVELPSGKMKSREGTVVDADDIIAEMLSIAKQKTEELGKVKDFNEAELVELYNTLGLGALKFFLLRVDPKKRMVFNPEESIEFQGFTGPFVQYTHARIKSILRKVGTVDGQLSTVNGMLLPLEKDLIVTLENFPAVIQEAATEYDPSKLANYAFNLAKKFNSFYTEHSIANAETEEKKQLRLHIAGLTATALKRSMGLLNIDVPERM